MANDMRKKYKAMLEAPEILVMPGVFDGFSTAIVEKWDLKRGSFPVRALVKAPLGLRISGSWALRTISTGPGPWWIFQAFRFRLTPIRVTAMR